MKTKIYLLGLNHRSAGVDVRESFALSPSSLQERGLAPEDVIPLGGAGGCITETMLLSTCNRVEILVVAKERPNTALAADFIPNFVLEAWAGARGRKAAELKPYVYIHEGAAAVEHLFVVASSLDSMVLGEPQILGQLKTAYKSSLECKKTGAILNKLLHRAFSVAKRVRTETGVASSAVSISYAAVELAKRIFGDMGQYRAMLIGAGEMAELAATHLVNAGIESVWVSNRTYSRAQELAAQYKGRAVPFEGLFDALADVDIVISSTGSPDPVIRAKDMRGVLKRRKNRPMFFIDIAVPRDIDPDVNGLDNIYLYDIDDLKEVVEENLSQRQGEAVKARAIVADETAAFCRWLEELALQPTIVALLERGQAVAAEELERTLKRIGPLEARQEEALRTMLYAILKKLHHAPIEFLKRRAFDAEGVEDGDTGGFSDSLPEASPGNFQNSLQGNLALVRRIFDLDKDRPAASESMYSRRRG